MILSMRDERLSMVSAVLAIISWLLVFGAIWFGKGRLTRLLSEVEDCAAVVKQVSATRDLGVSEEALGDCVPCILQEGGGEYSSRVAVPLAGEQLLIVDLLGDSDLVVPVTAMKYQPSSSRLFGVKQFVVSVRDVEYGGSARWMLFLSFPSESAAALGLT